MAKYLVKQPFKGAIHGIYVRDFVAGERAEIDDPDLARVALENGWIESYVEPIAEPEAKAATAAPKNRAMKAAPKEKTPPAPPSSSGASLTAGGESAE